MEKTNITVRSTFPKYMLIEMCRTQRRRTKEYYVLYDVTHLTVKTVTGRQNSLEISECCIPGDLA